MKLLTLNMKFGDEKTWVKFEVNDSIHLIATFAEGEIQKDFVEKLMNYIKQFSKIEVSCPTIKRWIEEYGFENVYYTELLKFRESLEKFNKYHSPEAVATFLDYENGIAIVKFSGPFCISCGLYDYFEDPIQDVKAEVLEYKEVEDGFIVKYKLKI